VIGKKFSEFFFFFGVGVEEGIGFKDLSNVFFIVLAVKFTFATGGEDFFKEVGKGANNIGFAEVGGGDMNGFFKYF
jgi:hypothetical protein